MALRSAYQTTHGNGPAPVAAPTKVLKISQTQFDAVSDALEKQFPGIEAKGEPVANADFVGVLSGDSKGQAILYTSGSLVLTGACVAFQWPLPVADPA